MKEDDPRTEGHREDHTTRRRTPRALGVHTRSRCVCGDSASARRLAPPPPPSASLTSDASGTHTGPRTGASGPAGAQAGARTAPRRCPRLRPPLPSPSLTRAPRRAAPCPAPRPHGLPPNTDPVGTKEKLPLPRRRFTVIHPVVTDPAPELNTGRLLRPQHAYVGVSLLDSYLLLNTRHWKTTGRSASEFKEQRQCPCGDQSPMEAPESSAHKPCSSRFLLISRVPTLSGPSPTWPRLCTGWLTHKEDHGVKTKTNKNGEKENFPR